MQKQPLKPSVLTYFFLIPLQLKVIVPSHFQSFLCKFSLSIMFLQFAHQHVLGINSVINSVLSAQQQGLHLLPSILNYCSLHLRINGSKEDNVIPHIQNRPKIQIFRRCIFLEVVGNSDGTNYEQFVDLRPVSQLCRWANKLYVINCERWSTNMDYQST